MEDEFQSYGEKETGVVGQPLQPEKSNSSNPESLQKGVQPAASPSHAPNKLSIRSAFLRSDDDRLDNRYRLIRKIGEGGMGEVWEANDERLGTTKRVAVKLIRSESQNNPLLVDLFLKEKDFLARCDHPHIVKVTDFLEQRDFYAIVTQFLEGMDLESFAQKQRVIGEKFFCTHMKQLVAGLEFAHQQGIVHRDIKPSNIFMEKHGKIMILDFGVAMMQSMEVNGISHMGTAAFMAPEQAANSELATAKSDQYSLAVTIAHAMHGCPWESPPIACIPKLSGRPCYAVLARAVAEDPRLRFDSISDFASAFVDAYRKSSKKGGATSKPPFMFDEFSQQLMVRSGRPSDFEFADFIQRVELSRVKTIDLSNSEITDATLEIIAVKIENLEQLVLNGCHRITEFGLSQLAGLPKLAVVSVDGCVDEDALQQAVPEIIPHELFKKLDRGN